MEQDTQKPEDGPTCQLIEMYLAVVEVGYVGRRVDVGTHEGCDERHRWGGRALLRTLWLRRQAAPASLQRISPHHCNKKERIFEKICWKEKTRLRNQVF